MDLAMAGEKTPATPEFLSGGGEMGRRIREFDWSATSLGPVALWPQSLRTCIRIMLDSRQPIWIGWGKDLINLYNDPYKAIVRGKHPWALGKPASVVWHDIWTTISPMLQQVMELDEGTYVESQFLMMERNGYPEETYYTFSYTPIPGDNGGTAGMICFNTDDTERIIGERQLSTLTRLGRSLTGSRSPGEIIHNTIDSLLDNPHDFPMACFYRIEGDTAVLSDCTHQRPAGFRSSGEAPGLRLPATIDLAASEGIAPVVKEALMGRQLQFLDAAEASLGRLPKGPWEKPPNRAMILPISQSGVPEPYGFLLTGLNPYRLPDEKYRGFFSLVADQVTTNFGNIHILDAERKRAQALAEIDEAKNIFFSNISHEFRTPLTLLLGPIEDALKDPEDLFNNRIRLELAHRNALRMQKLVNTLLEFSRIEAGRMDGHFMAVDIVNLTVDLASSFRSAIEKAGMQLKFDLGPVTAQVFVDTVMWEKIILNLVSNAFKYTIHGSITLRIRQHEGEISVSVTDTGIGIPADQIGHIFDRFHRVDNAAVRSQEGAGIGLALVRELVQIHHGRIEASSRVNEGSTFTITFPTGKAHLPPDQIGANERVRKTNERDIYIEEARQWLLNNTERPSALSPSLPDHISANGRFLVLLADDNADMRDYVGRLLLQQYDLITATNGEEAFERMLARQPDLVLTDIMMPRLDGFGLLKKIRSHPDLRTTPVILLSARAGEESKLEGLETGADDYLVKPFSARELLARVDSTIRINAARRLFEEKRRTVELDRLNSRLRQSNDDLRQFAHVASHDLKEPVRKIKVYAGRLQEDGKTTLSAKARSYLEKIDTAAGRMLTMIEGVLHYSTINSTGRATGPVDLNRIIRAIESDLELPIAEKKAALHYADLPTIDGAAVLLYQLFYNLINNSLKFSRTDVPCRIEISANIDRDQALICLSDNGIGFDQEQAESIFDTFSRLNNRDKYEGTGLGLSLCKKIVIRHGGDIEAIGKKGEGSEFRIRLPLQGRVGRLI